MAQDTVDFNQAPEGYRTPKLDGRRVSLRVRVTPDQHRLMRILSNHYAEKLSRDVSFSDLMGALLEREAGRRTFFDEDVRPPQEELPIRRSA